MTPSPKKTSLLAVLLALTFLFAEGPKLITDAKSKFDRTAASLQRGLETAKSIAEAADAKAREAQARADRLQALIDPLQAKVNAGTATSSEVIRLRDLVVQLQTAKPTSGPPGPPGNPGPPGSPGQTGSGGAPSPPPPPSSSSTTSTTRPSTTTTRPTPTTTTTRCTVGVGNLVKLGCR